MSDNNKIENENPLETEAEEFSGLELSENDQLAEEEFFDEEQDFSGDEEFLEEDWEAYDDEFSEDDAAAPAAAKKKKKSDKLIIGGGAVVGVLVLMFMMGGGAPAPQQAAPQAAAPAPQQQQVAAVVGQPAAPGQAPVNQRDLLYGRTGESGEIGVKKNNTGFFNDPDALENLEQDAERAFEDAGLYYEDEYYEEGEEEPFDDGFASTSSDLTDTDASGFYDQHEDQAPPMPTPIRQAATASGQNIDDEIESGLDIDFDTEMESAEEIPRSPAEQVRQPKTSDVSVALPKAQDVMIKKSAAASPQDTASGKMNPSFDMSAIEALNDKLDKISGRLESMEMTVVSLEENMISQSDIPDVSSIEKSVRALEKKVDSLSKQQVSVVQDRKTPALDLPEKVTESPKKTVSVTKKQPEKRITAPVEEAKMPAKEDSNWVLKAVQPGKAWVARQGESDMQTIEVGDSLAGIGKITAIDYIDGHWVVQGTTNKITQ